MMKPDGRSVSEQVGKAYERVRDHVYRTPFQRATWLEAGEGRVYLKLESEQVTGSFKARGAVSKIRALTEEQKAKGVITASTGNHALACTYAAQSLGDPNFKYEIVLPESASSAKVDALKALGAPMRLFGKDCLVAEMEAIRDARENGKEYISPYNDIYVIAGQGTIGVEVLEQYASMAENGTSTLDAIFVPVGGGGLICGIAAYFKAVSPQTKIFGCGPQNDSHMGRSIAAGRLLEVGTYEENEGVTLSEGTAGAVEEGSITFDICKESVDEWIELNEEDIGRAVVDMLQHHHKAVEGAAGLGIAGYRKKAKELRGKNVAIVICGGNVKAAMMRDLLNKYL